jgi:hypothetical protein
MQHDERDPRLARQELLEAYLHGFGGPACAPMPGTLIEMLEIAAMERQHSSLERAAAPADADIPLTAPRIGSRILARLRKAGDTIVDVAGRFRPGAGARRLPV